MEDINILIFFLNEKSNSAAWNKLGLLQQVTLPADQPFEYYFIY